MKNPDGPTRAFNLLQNTQNWPPSLTFLAILGVATLSAIVGSGTPMPPTLWTFLFAAIAAGGAIIGLFVPGTPPEQERSVPKRPIRGGGERSVKGRR